MSTRKQRIGKDAKYIFGIVCLIGAVLFTFLRNHNNSAQIFIIYVLVGIALVLFFFKMNDEASLTLKDVQGNGITISGGVAAVLILLWLNPIKRFLPDPKVGVTVVVSEKSGSIPLRDKGYVSMIPAEAETQKKPIDENGEASFSKVEEGENVKFDIDFSEPYHPLNPDSLYEIDGPKKINLIVRLRGIEKIEGNVICGNQPLDAVKVVSGTLYAFTDSIGSFFIDVPEKLQSKEYKVRFIKNGFITKEITWFPQIGSQTVLMEK